MESMVRHWNEIITELNAQTQARETRKANEPAKPKDTTPNGPESKESMLNEPVPAMS